MRSVVRGVFIALWLLFSLPSFADVFSDVQKCLSGQAAGVNKATCVQTAINAEETNQIQKLFQLYLNFANQAQNNNNGSMSGTNVPRSLVRVGTMGRAIPSLKVSNAPPSNPAVSVPAVSAPSRSAPKNQGGIQYY
jgi:hypothetical protein